MNDLTIFILGLRRHGRRLWQDCVVRYTMSYQWHDLIVSIVLVGSFDGRLPLSHVIWSEQLLLFIVHLQFGCPPIIAPFSAIHLGEQSGLLSFYIGRIATMVITGSITRALKTCQSVIYLLLDPHRQI